MSTSTSTSSTNWQSHAATTNDFSQPNNPVSLKPVVLPKSSTQQTRHSGGTADILPKERTKATFNIETLTNVLDGSVEATKRRRFIISPTENLDVSNKYYWDRPQGLKQHVQHFITTHEDYWDKIVPSREDVGYMSDNSMLSGSLLPHYGLFLPTVMNMADDEQMERYLPRILTMKITGCYAQTELGHGSNVRGLQTTATYDKTTHEFIIDTPTLQAIKWWPSGQGKVATHAVVYAQLIIDHKEYGVHVFMVQLRDENHRPLPGIEIGDLGPKMGDHWNDTGFIRFHQIRIPRTEMLSRHQQVTPDGHYVKKQIKQNDKVHYATMMWTRGAMVKIAGGALARAVTIAIRYSCVRQQGFADSGAESFRSRERQIIDWQVQRYRLFKQLSIAYAMRFTGSWMTGAMGQIDVNSPAVQEIAAVSAGLKALCTVLAANGIEDCRKCCGGNGYLLNSGVAAQSADYVWQTTAEGDFVVMLLQSARFLIKTLRGARQGQNMSGTMDYLSALRHSASNNVSSLTPPSAATSSDMLCDPQYLLQWFKYRALVEVATVGAELDRRMTTGITSDEAWNSCAVQLCAAVVAHCHAFILSQFVQAVAGVADKSVAAVLTRLCAVYGCTSMLDEAWPGILSTTHIQYTRVAVTQLLDQLRPDAVALVDAFDLPDRVLCSTLGRYDGNIYESLFEASLKSNLNHSDPFDGYEFLRKYLDLDFISQGAQVYRKSNL